MPKGNIGFYIIKKKDGVNLSAETHGEINRRILEILNNINAELSLELSSERRFLLVATSEKLLRLQNQIPFLIKESAAPAKVTEAAKLLIAEIEALRTAIRQDTLCQLSPEHIAMILSP